MRSFFTFLRSLIAAPSQTGAIAPSSDMLAEAMVRALDPADEITILELGPGTGVMTRALIKAGVREDQLILSELSSDFCKELQNQFPQARILNEDAVETVKSLRQSLSGKCAVISSLPLRNFSGKQRRQLAREIAKLIGPDHRYVQFTYRWFGRPVSSKALQARKVERVLGNLPPATVWSYRARTPKP